MLSTETTTDYLYYWTNCSAWICNCNRSRRSEHSDESKYGRHIPKSKSTTRWKLTKCKKCCAFSSILCLLLVYWMLFYSHRLLCSSTHTLCEPWSAYLQRLRRPQYAAMTADEYAHAQQLLSFSAAKPESESKSKSKSKSGVNANDGTRTASACAVCNSTFVHPCPRAIKLGLLLGQRHGGTTFVTETLKSTNAKTTNTQTHSNDHQRVIITDDEQMMHWEQSACSTYAQYVKWSQECTLRAFIAEMDRIYARFFAFGGGESETQSRMERLCHQQSATQEQAPDGTRAADAGVSDDYAYYYIWRLQIDQFPPAFYATLVEYFACHDIQIVHLLRDASVAAFWSVQAQSVESVAALADSKYELSQRLERATTKVRFGDIQSMALDAQLARRYVLDMDTNRAYLGKLIRLYGRQQRVIQYMRFYYEDLIGPYSQSYWDSMLAFIGIGIDNNNDDGTTASSSKSIVVRPREHHLPCYRKIENWKEVKLALQGTASYYACEKPYS